MISLKSLNYTLLLALVVTCFFSCVKPEFEETYPRSNTSDKKPNIIFLLTDDQRWDALGAAGNAIIHTPNMDDLAQAGLQFDNAYVTTSICCVSRASLLTGQYESRHNIHDFKTDLTSAQFAQSYPAILKRAGYKLGFIGKYGVGLNPPAGSFDYWVNTEAGGRLQPDYITIGQNGLPIHDTDTIGSAIQQFLSTYGKKNAFCLSVSFKAPHEQDGFPPKYVIQSRFTDYYQNAAIPVPKTADPKYWKQMPGFFQTDQNLARARWKGFLNTPELFQENVKNYYRLITGVDAVIGDMRQKLEQLGVADNTIIILMGDNGMMLGEHGIEGKWYGYEESIRVPLVIYNPLINGRLREHRVPNMALNIDIAPTILGMAGLRAPYGMQGVNLIDLVENKITDRSDFFYQHYFLGSPAIPKEEGVVTKKFKYMNFIENGYEELYDISKDPHETTNLAKDPRYTWKVKELRKRHKELRKAVL